MAPAEGIVPVADVPAAITAIRFVGLLREESSRILTNWSMRIATLPVFRAAPELALDDLQRGIPELLDAILLAVSVSPYEYDLEPMETATRVAALHGADRSSSFPIDVTLSEIQMLQHEVRNGIWRHAEGISSSVVHELDDRLNDVFEQVERALVAGWVEKAMGQYPVESTGEAA
jgi:hypothetical protein